MGKILAGILSGVSGKVAGVVGGKWKDVNYLRAYVKPANPNTEDQQIQRSLFGSAVAFAKLLVGQIFNVYTDKFLKSMSGFNYFIKHNIEYFTDPITYQSIKITEGKLFFGGVSAAIYAGSDVTVAYSDAYGSNGNGTDLITGVLHNKAIGKFYFPESEGTRDGGAMTFSPGSGLSAANLVVYIFAAQLVDEVLIMISDSDYFQVTT